MPIDIKNRYTGAVLRTVEADTLRGVYLYGADLRWANLYGADLRVANLRGADLSGADLRGARMSDDVFVSRPPICVTIPGVPWPIFIWEGWAQVGCQLHLLLDWESSVGEDLAVEHSLRETWLKIAPLLVKLAEADGRLEPYKMEKTDADHA